MNYFISLSILLVSSLCSSIILTKYLTKFMVKFGVVDVPSQRRAHKKITPRGGGVGLVIIYCIIFPIFEYIHSDSFIYSEKILQIFIPIAIISFWDDIHNVSISLRLFVHFLCACLAIMWLVHPFSLFHNELPPYLDLFISTFALAAFINIYNFLDGIDGISASESIHLSCTILILCALKADLIPNVGFIIVTITILLGWSVGFIIFNWQPAKIFLGDAGSISLGFLYGLCLILIATASDRLFASSAIASLYYIADGGLTIMIRLVNGEKIWEPHLKHFFQKAVKNGRTHSEVVRKIIKCNFILMLLAVGALYYPIVSIILAVITVMITLIRLDA